MSEPIAVISGLSRKSSVGPHAEKSLMTREPLRGNEITSSCRDSVDCIRAEATDMKCE